MAGLTAARELTRLGHAVTVLDKGRGIGGRMATRRIGLARADHGAQYLTAQTPGFTDLMESLTAEGVAAGWHLNGERSYVGTSGMSGIAKHLAQGLHVQLNEKVVRLTTETTGWRAETETGSVYRAYTVLLTTPVPQALALLNDSGITLETTDGAALETIRYEPSLTVLATLNQSPALPMPGFLQNPFPEIAWVVDNQQKGISPEQPSVTIHASAAFIHQHLDGDLEAAGRELLGLLQNQIPAGSINDVQVHRWRYSHADRQHPHPFLAASAPFPLLFGGDGFGREDLSGLRSGVERAYASGRAMAEFLGLSTGTTS